MKRPVDAAKILAFKAEKVGRASARARPSGLAMAGLKGGRGLRPPHPQPVGLILTPMPIRIAHEPEPAASRVALGRSGARAPGRSDWRVSAGPGGGRNPARARAMREQIRAGGACGEPTEKRVLSALGALARPSLRRVINATGVVLHTSLGARRWRPGADSGLLEPGVRPGGRPRGKTRRSPLGADRAPAGRARDRRQQQRRGGLPGAPRTRRRIRGDRLAGRVIEIGDASGSRTSWRVRAPCSARSLHQPHSYGRLPRGVHRTHAADPARCTGPTSASSGSPRSRNSRNSPCWRASAACRCTRTWAAVCLADLAAFGIHEPVSAGKPGRRRRPHLVQRRQTAGGPQAGLLAGRQDLVARLRRNPMFRALRADKLIYQALEETLRRWLLERWDEIPALA